MVVDALTSLPALARTALLQPADPVWLTTLRELWSYLYPYRYFLLVLIVFWFFARRSREPDDLAAQAQRVLEEKYRAGEISQKAYEKYRQDIAMRPRR